MLSEPKVRWWHHLVSRRSIIVAAGWCLARGQTILALHWCPGCRVRRFDHLYDPLSLAERIVCGGCGLESTTRIDFGLSLFVVAQYWRMSANSKKRRRHFIRLCFVGPKSEELPLDRGGKTFHDLETEEIMRVMIDFIEMQKLVR